MLRANKLQADNPGRHLKVMPDHARDTLVKDIFATIADRIDFLSSLFCFGMDEIWRRKLVSSSKLSSGEKVLDVCTGTGKLAFLLSKKVRPEGSVVGADFCEEMLVVARKNFSSKAPNISFVISDAKNLIFDDNSFDVVTVSFGIRNVPDTSQALREARRVLKPGGRFYCLELTSPQKTWFMPFYDYYCFHIMPFIAKMILKTGIPFNYLPRSIHAFPSADEFGHMIEECGFSDVTVHRMSLGVATLFAARR
jgi:demethylmenaquinone methyltransferase/2-methoxy-6-polyprenyl-1,4-benzoquinol methylase